jgi:D-aspartate ligase
MKANLTHVELAPANAPVVLATRHPSTNGVPGAVVVGGDYQGLGIVRSLGRQGIPVCVVDDEPSIARFSRYSSRSVRVEDLRSDSTIVHNVLAIGRKLGLQGWVLYPTRDEMVAAFSRHRDELSKMFSVPTPAWECVHWAWDKRDTYRIARQLDIPIPQTWCPQNSSELAQIDIEAPYAIKPAIKEHFFYATKAKAWAANSRQELESLFQKASAIAGAGEIIIQEVIPGGGAQQFSYCAFFRDGEAVGKMVVRRARQHPLQFGRASTYVETVDLPILEKLSEKLLRAIGYYGLAEVEYKLDPRDGQYKLLDLNARTWGYHSLGARAGVDFSHMLHADQSGMPVIPCKGQPGMSWMRMTTDLPTSFLELFGGHLNVRGYLRSLQSCSVDAVFSSDDPLPGLTEVLMLPYFLVKKGF